MSRILLSVCLVIFSNATLQAQEICDPANQFVEEAFIEGVCNALTMASQVDQNGRPYLYIANKEAGVTIYDITDLNNPNFISGVSTDDLSDSEVMALTQVNNYLYLALGNHFVSSSAGLAIVDVSDPSIPILIWHQLLDSTTSGAGDIYVEDGILYLGAMQEGVFAFNVEDPTNPIFLSQFIPDIQFPHPNPSPNKYNARGIHMQAQIMFLCYDAGGLRVIDYADPAVPIEVGRYANPATFQPINLPRAYNNVIVKDTLAFIAVDYCGIEVLDVSSLSEINLLNWWNPLGCPQSNWFNSPLHTNELYLNESCNRLYISAGRSEVISIDISDPSRLATCTTFGDIDNGESAWGISGWGNTLFVSYICSPGGAFISTSTGVRVIRDDFCNETTSIQEESFPPRLYPNPARDIIMIDALASKTDSSVYLYDLAGKIYQPYSDKNHIDISHLPSGIYIVVIPGKQPIRMVKI